MKRYTLSELAKADLASIKAYLKVEAGIPATRRVLHDISNAIERIGSMPGLGHVREDLTTLPVKFWQVRAYFVIYTPQARPIEIIRILHASRDIPRLLAPR
ncbi:MAG TPA: type II toxin-antitoxin system RelE/ParE family toxin [Alphaproteobacteria bacterium]|nr:type II toxin-antitoxin system RelE/ParE family toxin [Alphaproteobacteria bacterium]